MWQHPLFAWPLPGSFIPFHSGWDLSAATPAMHDNSQAPRGEPCRCFTTHTLFNHPIGAAWLTPPSKTIIIIRHCWETGNGRRKPGGCPWDPQDWSPGQRSSRHWDFWLCLPSEHISLQHAQPAAWPLPWLIREEA